ncbi:hypothetical protein [Neisseria bacilliformis]|nr:hypothetical protein [Neisseria bacilliformis]
MTATIFFRRPQRLPEKTQIPPNPLPTHNKKALRMKYECYIQCGKHPKTMLKNMLSNIAAHKENFQILIQDYRPPFPHQEHRYDDAPYHVFNGRDASNTLNRFTNPSAAASFTPNPTNSPSPYSTASKPTPTCTTATSNF